MMLCYIREVLSLLAPDQRSRLPVLILFFIGLSFLDLLGIGLIGPYVAIVISDSAVEGGLGIIFDFLGLSKDKEVVLIFFGWSLVGIFFIKTALAIWMNRKIILFGQDQQVFLRSALMEVYQSLSYTDYLERNSSEYIYTIQKLAGDAQVVTIMCLRILCDSIVALVIVCLLAFQNIIALGLLVGFLGTAVIIYDRLFRDKMKTYGREYNLASTAMVQGINEGIEGLKEIRILGRESYFHNLVAKATKKIAYFQTQELVINTAPRFLMEFLMIMFIVTLILGTLYLGQSLQMLIPTIAMFGVAALRLLPIANMLSGSLANIRFQRDGISRLYNEVSKFGNSIKSNSKKTIPQSKRAFEKIVLDGISFRYPGISKDALKGISLEIQSGESIGLIGASGSGKTTLVDVLLGLLEPYEGDVLYNDNHIKGSLDEWRSHIAYLPQQVFLIDNTLRRNIALGCQDDDIDNNRVDEALRQARLSDFLKLLPLGLDTVLGERGVRLSGGQRQRVALARAFYHGRNILVMDESTSALDKETENEIVDEIRRLKGDKTMIVIAHRLSTVADCDRIYRLDSGKIVEQGPPKEILRE
jgi:ABC-type multidrug transport system fused ATPase/permease subunit